MRFLDLLPKALMLDKGIENASFDWKPPKRRKRHLELDGIQKLTSH